MELTIAIIGAIVSIVISSTGAYLSVRNSIILEQRKSRENLYVDYIESLQEWSCNASDRGKKKHYLRCRPNYFCLPVRIRLKLWRNSKKKINYL